MEHCVTGTLGVILMGDWRSEQRHDPVAGVLVYGAFETVNPICEQTEEPIHDFVPLFGAHLRGELDRSFHIRKQHRHLLALAFEGGLGLKDLLGEMLWCVGARIALRRFLRSCG
jgi:hypothetical protein